MGPYTPFAQVTSSLFRVQLLLQILDLKSKHDFLLLAMLDNISFRHSGRHVPAHWLTQFLLGARRTDIRSSVLINQLKRTLS